MTCLGVDEHVNVRTIDTVAAESCMLLTSSQCPHTHCRSCNPQRQSQQRTRRPSMGRRRRRRRSIRRRAKRGTDVNTRSTGDAVPALIVMTVMPVHAAAAPAAAATAMAEAPAQTQMLDAGRVTSTSASMRYQTAVVTTLGTIQATSTRKESTEGASSPAIGMFPTSGAILCAVLQIDRQLLEPWL